MRHGRALEGLSSAAILTHSTGMGFSGPSHFLLEFLKQLNVRTEWIEFPLPGFVREGDPAEPTSDARGPVSPADSSVPAQLEHSALLFLRTLIFHSPNGDRDSIAFCADPLSALLGAILRLRKHYRYVVYYAVDYSEKRFNSPILSIVYAALRRLALTLSDEIWCSTVQIQAKLHEIRPNRRYFVVPNGVSSEFLRDPPDHVASEIWFIGTMTHLVALDLAIIALSRLSPMFPEIRLHLVGDGPARNGLERLASRLGVSERVRFYGRVAHPDIPSLVRGGIGIALYKDDPRSNVAFGDSMKVKEYIALGLPLVVTKNTPASDWVERSGVGLVCAPTTDKVVESIVTLLSNPGLCLTIRQNMTRIGPLLTWENSFSPVIKRLCCEIEASSLAREQDYRPRRKP